MICEWRISFFFVLYFSVSGGSLLVIVIMQFLNLAVKIQCSRVIAKRSASIFAIVKRFDHKAGESNAGLKNQYRLITLKNFLYRCLR